MRKLLAATLLATCLAGQAPVAKDLPRLLRDLELAIQNQDFVKAATLADELDAGVRDRLRVSVIGKSATDVDALLALLPSGVETLLVHQEPFSLDTDLSQDGNPALWGEPTRRRMMECISRFDDGNVYRRLHGRGIRMGVLAGRHLEQVNSGRINGAPVVHTDWTCFLWLTERVDESLLGPPSENARSRALWTWNPPQNRFSDGKAHWVALPRPDLLMVTNERGALDEVLALSDKVAPAPNALALSKLQAWKQINRQAPAWAFRGFSSGDPSAMTAQVDAATGLLEIFYMSQAETPPFSKDLSPDFQPDQPRPGTWRYRANMKDRGAFLILHLFGVLGLVF